MKYLFWIGLAIFIIGSYADYWKSTRQIEYGTTEGNGINADKYGYFSPARFWIFHALFALPFVLLYLFTGEVLFAFGLVIVGAISAFQAIKDIGVQKRSRARQIAALTALKKIYPYDYLKAAEAVGTQKIYIKGGRGYYEDFAWFYCDIEGGVTNENLDKTARIVLPYVWELSQKKDWFSDTRVRRVI